jgi:hypothetical protein
MKLATSLFTFAYLARPEFETRVRFFFTFVCYIKNKTQWRKINFQLETLTIVATMILKKWLAEGRWRRNVLGVLYNSMMLGPSLKLSSRCTGLSLKLGSRCTGPSLKLGSDTYNFQMYWVCLFYFLL